MTTTHETLLTHIANGMERRMNDYFQPPSLGGTLNFRPIAPPPDGRRDLTIRCAVAPEKDGLRVRVSEEGDLIIRMYHNEETRSVYLNDETAAALGTKLAAYLNRPKPLQQPVSPLVEWS